MLAGVTGETVKQGSPFGYNLEFLKFQHNKPRVRQSNLSMDGLIAAHHGPDLEVDRRDDQFPTVYRENIPKGFPADEKPLPLGEPAPLETRIFGFRKSTFWLSGALVVILVLAAIGAGVAGSFAVSRKSDIEKCSIKPQPANSAPTSTSTVPPAQSVTPSCSCPNSTSTVPPAESATPSSSCPNATSSMQPTSDCKSLRSPYTAQVSHAQFDLSCETDYYDNDILAVYVYRFETCIEACADMNQRHQDTPCAGVSYDTAVLEGNCFLKASGSRQVASTKNTISSARLKLG